MFFEILCSSNVQTNATTRVYLSEWFSVSHLAAETLIGGNDTLATTCNITLDSAGQQIWKAAVR